MHQCFWQSRIRSDPQSPFFKITAKLLPVTWSSCTSSGVAGHTIIAGNVSERPTLVHFSFHLWLLCHAIYSIQCILYTLHKIKKQKNSFSKVSNSKIVFKSEVCQKKTQKKKNRRKDVILFLVQICDKQKMQQSWWFRFLTSNHVHSSKKCIGLLCALNQAPLLCVWAWLGCAFCFECFYVGAASRFLYWTRVWYFMTVLAVYFMHVYIGLRPGWLALVVGVFCVRTLHWKLVGLCLYFVFVFLSCIGSGSSWFVGVFFSCS